MIRIHCSKADATLLETETLTAGMVNIPSVLFTFSSDWDGLGKTAIVRAGTVIREVILTNNQITIPSECLAKAGVNLIVGVWGGNFITELPTVWCACGEIQDSTNPSTASNHETPTASNVAQMLAAAERAEEAVERMGDINWDDIADRIISELSETEIQDAIDDWLDAHPEATTTVEDQSLTYNKLILGTLNYVIPEMFGAAGNGITDDTTAMNAAIQDGRPVLLGSGKTYLISDRLYIKDNMLLVGGNNSAIKWTTFPASKQNHTKLGGESKTNLCFKNIIFDFGVQEVTSNNISLIGCSHIKFIDCKFYNANGSAMRISETHHVLIQGCHFENITGAVGGPGEAVFGSNFHDAQIIACTGKNISDHFLYADGSVEVYNLIVSDCILDETGENGLTNGAALCLYSNVHDATITNCVITPDGAGIYLGVHGSSTLLPSNIDISNCAINGGTFGIGVYGLSDSTLLDGVKISGCSVANTSSDCIDIRYAKNMVISDCTLDRTGRTALSVDSFFYSIVTGIHIKNVSEGCSGIIVGSGRANNNGGYVIFDDIYISGDPESSGLYPLYTRRGSNYTIGNIVEDEYFVNGSVYPSGYGKPVSYSKTWTPVVRGGTATGNVTFSSGRATYAVAGKLVLVSCEGKIDDANEGKYLQISGFQVPVTIFSFGITINSSTGLIGQANISMDQDTPILTAYFTSQNPITANQTFKVCALAIMA